MLSTNGDTFLGGEDFDNALIEYLVEEFKKEQNVNLKTIHLRYNVWKKLLKSKIELSSNATEINLPYITADATGPKHLVINVTRAKLEGLVADLVARTIEPCKIALKDAGLSTSDISDVILVGGQSRMPLVQQKYKNSSVESHVKTWTLTKQLQSVLQFKVLYCLVTRTTYCFLT